MTLVHLYGRLKARFGGPFSLAVSSTAEAIRALSVNLPGFTKELRIGAYRITAGDRRKGRKVTGDTLGLGLPANAPLHIVPVTSGSKKGGVGKLIMGVALIAVATVASGGAFGAFAGGAYGGLGWGTVAMFGAAFAFAGVAQLLTPTPKGPDVGNLERPEERPSFMMGSPVNVASQGNPIPIIGGRVRTGSVVASMGISTERIAVPT
jgi:predicted phage tail protein